MRRLVRNLSVTSRSGRGLPWVVSVLLGTGLGLFGCSAETNQNVGCNLDSDCPNNLHCNPTGLCVAPPTYTSVTIVKLGDGDGTITSSPAGLSCEATCSAMFAVGEQLTLTAAPNAGSKLASFSVGCNSSTSTCTFSPTDASTPVQVLVNFSLGDAAPAPAICNGSGYCWENPRPQGNRLNKAISVGLNDEWAVGDAGTIVHRTSTATTLVVSGTTRNLYSIWASGTDLYAVGEGGIILHSSGGSWSSESSSPSVTTDLYDVTSSGGNLFAVGAAGVILKRNTGAFWTKETSNTVRDLHGLVGTPSGDVYAVGNNATVVRYTGGTWTASTDGLLNNSNLNAIATGATGSPLYITSGSGDIFSLSAGTYTRLYQTNQADLRGIAVSSFGIIAVGQQGTVGTILRSTTGTTWTAEAINSQNALNAVAAGSAEVIAVGESGAMQRYDGNPWTPLSSGLTSQLRAVHGVDAQHAWAVGLSGTLFQWNGTYWNLVTLTGTVPSFYGVFAVSATDAWAVGTGGAVWRWNGTAWNKQTTGTTATLRAVWAAAANKVYVVGDGGVALMWDGTIWNQVGAGNGVNLAAVSGSSATDVWAAGDNGTVLRLNGSGAFTAVSGGLGTTAAVGGIWASAANNVWFAADTNMYLFDGTKYTPYTPTPAVTGLRAVSGAGTEVYAVGNAGALVRWNSASWDRVDTGTKRDFYGLFLGAQKQWLAGDYGALLSKPR